MNPSLHALSLSSAYSPALAEALTGADEHWQKNLDSSFLWEELLGRLSRGRFEGFTLLMRRSEQISLECRQHQISILTIDQEDYPCRLRHIFDPPLALYVRGTGSALSDGLRSLSVPCCAVVGTRRPEISSIDFTRHAAGSAAAAGMLIISGMALGIDAQAHAAALPTGRTIAVLGCGPEQAYPVSNRPLYRRILEAGGLVLSEYPPGMPPLRHHFPRRNRIISGLSDAVLMVQAPQRSGALITVRFALEHNREVLTMTPPPAHEGFAGNRQLISEGAAAVASADDLISLVCGRTPQTVGGTRAAGSDRILTALSIVPKSLGELSAELAAPAAWLGSRLAALSIKGVVREAPGMRYYRLT